MLYWIDYNEELLLIISMNQKCWQEFVRLYWVVFAPQEW